MINSAIFIRYRLAPIKLDQKRINLNYVENFLDLYEINDHDRDKYQWSFFMNMNPIETQSKRMDTPIGSVPANFHPWRRFWAKYIDIILFANIPWTLIQSYFDIDVDHIPIIYFTNRIILTAFALLLIEPLVISTIGTTPGKWVFGITLTKDGEKLKLKKAFWRGFVAWYQGYGVLIPFWCLITLTKSYDKLKTDGLTPWDKLCGTQVEHGKVRLLPLIILIIILILVINSL